MSTGLIYPPCCYARHRRADRARPRAGGGAAARWSCTCAARATASWRRVAEMVTVARRVGLRRARSRTSRSPAATTGTSADEWSALIERRARRGPAPHRRPVPLRRGQHAARRDPAARGPTTAAPRPRSRACATPRRARGCARRWPTRRPRDWDNFWKWSGPEGIVIADIPSGRHPEWLGKSLAEVARRCGQGPVRGRVRPAAGGAHGRGHGLVLAGRGRGGALPGAALRQRLHRRPARRPARTRAPTARTRASSGATCASERMLTLEEAVRKMTSQAAAAFGFARHGPRARGLRAPTWSCSTPRRWPTAPPSRSRAVPGGHPRRAGRRRARRARRRADRARARARSYSRSRHAGAHRSARLVHARGPRRLGHGTPRTA